MSVNPLYRSSPTRVMGISSGMDTEYLIQQMMRAHQMRYDSKFRSKTLLEWKQQSYNNIRDELTNFRRTYLTNLGANAMFPSSAYNLTKVEVTGKNAAAVSVSAPSGAPTGTIKIESITSIAQGASATSTAKQSGVTMKTKLGDTAYLDGNTTADIEINGETITLNENMTVEGMLNAVNSSGANAKLSFDALSQRFTIESKDVGEDSSLEISGLTALGLTDGTYENGTDTVAKISINGKLVDIDPLSNVVELGGGIKITLNSTIAAGDDPVYVNIKRDATDAVNKIKGFIDTYNSIIKKLESLVRERKSTKEASYLPLTDEEKSSMTEKQIADWEEIARKGLLRNDNGIQRLTTQLRGALFEKVTSAGMSPSDIGLSTGDFFGGTGGQIILDEEKLKKALEADPDKVISVFNSNSIDATFKDKGLLNRMDDLMRDYVNDQRVTLKNLEDSLRRSNEQMEKMQLKMYQEEDKLYKQFAAMESALSNLQQQGDWFSAMLGSNK